MIQSEQSKGSPCATRGHPSAEDRARMSKLYAEVVTRLEEMARITGRALNIASPSPVQRATLIIPSKGEPGTPEEPSTILEATLMGGDTVCYQDPPGLCCTGPCPCTVVLHEYRVKTA
jgi:hypothetical protein